MKPLRRRWLNLPAWLRRSLIPMLCLMLLGAYLLWQYQRPGGAILYGHNHTDRPIFSYWVNGNWGGNGGATCCWLIAGEKLKVVWIVSRTREQIDQGAERERHELEISNPPRERADDTLHVHIIPGNQVRLAWSHSAGSPLADELRQQSSRKNNDKP